MAMKGVTWSGLDSFEAELRTLTADMVDEANAILVESAEAAKRDIAAAYPTKSGALRRGLVLKPARGTVLAGAELLQRAPHANIYEGGTVERHTHRWPTAAGCRRLPRSTPSRRPIGARRSVRSSSACTNTARRA